ncbi:MAG: flagellar biosynthesis protein [Maritimibacter sp.]|nr:flagellar biosynthesis protein [Maritimibacter sp.]MAQ81756.1 flagellar biosynthesis protein [Maritimibacter sp.]
MPGLSLEDFDTAVQPAPADPVTPNAPGPSEADRTAAYEDGYRAGWDDANRANTEEQERIGAEFARNLQEMSFTFHEARAHVIQSLEPLLNELVGCLLPGLVAETFALAVQEELRPLIAENVDTPVELVVGPGGSAILGAEIERSAAAAVRLVEEPTLAEGQAYLRVGKVERQIDLSGALERIRSAVAALYELNERTLQHG